MEALLVGAGFTITATGTTVGLGELVVGELAWSAATLHNKSLARSISQPNLEHDSAPVRSHPGIFNNNPQKRTSGPPLVERRLPLVAQPCKDDSSHSVSTASAENKVLAPTRHIMSPVDDELYKAVPEKPRPRSYLWTHDDFERVEFCEAEGFVSETFKKHSLSLLPLSRGIASSSTSACTDSAPSSPKSSSSLCFSDVPEQQSVSIDDRCSSEKVMSKTCKHSRSMRELGCVLDSDLQSIEEDMVNVTAELMMMRAQMAALRSGQPQ